MKRKLRPWVWRVIHQCIAHPLLLVAEFAEKLHNKSAKEGWDD